MIAFVGPYLTSLFYCARREMYVKITFAQEVLVVGAAFRGQSDVKTRGRPQQLLHFAIVRSNPTQRREHRLLHHVA